MTREEQKRWELLKHYASVLGSFFGWTMCVTQADGNSILFQRRGSESSETMEASKVLQAGQALEEQQSRAK